MSARGLLFGAFAAILLALVAVDPPDLAGFGFALGLAAGALWLFRVAFVWMLAAGLVLLATILTTPQPTGTPPDFLGGVVFGVIVAWGLKVALARLTP